MFLGPTIPADSKELQGDVLEICRCQQGDERLLKLYESGLPAWAIYAPQYGIWYRPWMRRVTYALFILVSTFSLVVGFYDLYKNVPYLDQVRKLQKLFPW